MKIIQLLPELKVGGVERGTVDLSDYLTNLGHDSAVISSGGQLVGLLSDHGAKHFELSIAKKNLKALSQISNLKKNLSRFSARYSSCQIKISCMDQLLCIKKFYR